MIRRASTVILLVLLSTTARLELPGAQEPADPAIFADQLRIYAHISSASFEEDMAEDVAAGTRYGISYHMKGAKFRVIRWEGTNPGHKVDSLVYVANNDGWQYLEGKTDLFLMHKGPGYPVYSEIPYSGFMPCPLSLQLFSFLAYHDHHATNSLTLGWDQLLDPDWVKAHLTTSLATVEHGADGTTILHVPQTSAKKVGENEFVEALQNAEARYLIRPFPEFGGVRLIAEIHWGWVDQAPMLRERITYRLVTAADGSGPYPLPSQAVTTEWGKEVAVSTQTVTAVHLGIPIDDSEFEIDPTHVRTINDFAVNGGLVPLQKDANGEGGK